MRVYLQSHLIQGSNFSALKVFSSGPLYGEIIMCICYCNFLIGDEILWYCPSNVIFSAEILGFTIYCLGLYRKEI